MLLAGLLPNSMKIYNHISSPAKEIPGDWVHVNDENTEIECPMCGSEPGQCCSYEDPDREGFGIEVSSFVHSLRIL